MSKNVYFFDTLIEPVEANDMINSGRWYCRIVCHVRQEREEDEEDSEL